MWASRILGLPNQSEILIINIIGIISQTVELLTLQLQSDLDKVWNIKLNYLGNLESTVQYLVAGVVLARTFTLHAFLGFYLIMLWPSIFKEKFILMVPWLVLGLVRCLLLNLFTLLLGEYICFNEAGVSLLCLDYVIAQTLDHGLSVYAWVSVLRYYKTMVEPSTVVSKNLKADSQSDDSLSKTKSYSLTDLNMDYLYSNRMKNLPGDTPIELFIKELSILHRKRILQDSSKSFDSLLNQVIPKIPDDTKNSLAERTMKTLGITPGDLSKAKEHKNNYLEVLKDLSISDVVEFPPPTKFRQCQSQLEDSKIYTACLYYVKSQLQREQSNQTLCESEIANVTLNEIEGDRMAGGQCVVFNPNLFLQKFALKKNTSKNFGCQVTMLKRGFLQQSRDQLAKKLMFFRTLGLA